MILTATYADTLGRITLSITGMTSGNHSITVTRSSLRPHVSGQAAVPYATGNVRGTLPLIVTGTATSVYDYEYDPSDGSENWYTVYQATDSVSLESAQVSIRPVQTMWWIKSVQHPARNISAATGTSHDSGIGMTLVDLTSSTRSARQGRYEIIGSNLPVIISDVHTSTTLTATIYVSDRAKANQLESLIAGGDVLLLQPPTVVDAPGPLWVSPGELTIERQGADRSRLVVVELNECSPPSDLIIGSTWTYQNINDTYITYSTLMGHNAAYLALREGPVA